MIINLKSQTDLSGFYVIYYGSTTLEKVGERGTSHILEHMLCKELDDYQDQFEIDGIDFNAYTSSNEVVFYIQGLEDKIGKWRDKFVSALMNTNVDKKSFENEKSVVLEEYDDYFNEQTANHDLNLMRKLFNYYDPIGAKEDLENFTYLKYLSFFERNYLKPSKIVNVSKTVDYKNDTIKFQDLSNDLKFEYLENNKFTFEKGNDGGTKTSIIMLSPFVETKFPEIKILNLMLCTGLNSPLYQEVREKRGLVYSISCSLSRLNKQGIVSISTQTSDKNYQAVVDAIKGVLDNPDTYLTEERFNNVVDMYKVELTKSDINRFKNIGRWIDPKDWDLKAKIDTIKYVDVMEVYKKLYKFDKWYISNDKTEFKKNG